MFTKFEQFATTTLMGSQESPPRKNGHLYFERGWEKTAFGLVIALAKQGNYEWEDFRQQLIAKISEWEAQHPRDDSSWDYYQRWLLALEEVVFNANLIDETELNQRTKQILETCRSVDESYQFFNSQQSTK